MPLAAFFSGSRDRSGARSTRSSGFSRFEIRAARPPRASLQEALDVPGPLGGVLLAELEQALQVVGLEHDQADQVVRARLLGPEPARQEAERARQAGLVLVREASEVARGAQQQE